MNERVSHIHDSTRERSQSDGRQGRRHDNKLAMPEKYRVVHYERKVHFHEKRTDFFSGTDTIKCGTNQMNAGDNVMSIYLSKIDTALNDNLEKLNRICALKDNWDGYGAEPLPEHTITRADELIRKLRIQPEIFPTADGTIQIEYEKDNGDYLEFQFSGNGTCEVFRRMNGKEEYFNALDDYSSINALTEAFYG